MVGVIVVKSAILCVYYVPEDMEWVFDLQLAQIRKCSEDYKIYAAFIKGSQRVLSVLQESSDIILCEVSAESDHPSKQHSMALTQLMNYAVNFGVEAIYTLDVDSFPISKSWMKQMYNSASQNNGVCAVHRIENGDKFLPHPSGCVVLTEFLKKNPFEFYPENIETTGKTFIDESGQRPDSGIGLGYVLWKGNKMWAQLERSNERDLHYMMAGIYGNVVFHLGAGSRGPLFAKEVNESPVLKALRTFEKMPVLWRLYAFFKKRTEASLIERNTKIVTEIESRLKKDAEQFFTYLKSN